jgi:hypothetical protein
LEQLAFSFCKISKATGIKIFFIPSFPLVHFYSIFLTIRMFD